MRSHPFSTRLLFPLALLFLLAACAYGMLYMRATAEHRQLLEVEAAKSMLQVMAVALLGNIVLMIVRDYEERRKSWIARRDLLRTDLSKGLGDLYSKSKQARRLLRASTDLIEETIVRAKHDELLEEVSDIQLKIEGLQRAAEAGVRRKIIPDLVPDRLKSMEHYLGTLVTEYEAAVPAKSDPVGVCNRLRFKDFIAKSGDSEFRSQFVRPYHEATHAIERVIENDLG